MNLIGESLFDGADLDIRKASVQDHDFGYQLFVSTREDFFQLGLPSDFLEKMLKQQYGLQQKAYVQQWPDSISWIISVLGLAVGKITLAQQDNRLHIVDIAFLKSHRRAGLGSQLLKFIQYRARESHLRITLMVDKHNTKAQAFYHRLGFLRLSETDTHFFMSWE